VLEAYFVAYIIHFHDQMVYALGDVEAIIRARYIGVPASTTERVQLLYNLSSREFEQTVENLYAGWILTRN
jgi:hypothetical protein